VSLDYISKTFHEAGIGNGPVDALNDALQKIVRKVFPNLKNYHLSDYRVKIINPNAATAAKVRVLIEFSDRKDIWTTVGVHENIIEASWIALKDGIDYMRLKNSRSTSTF
jgi:2-isopropylmalate synthase